MAASPFMPLYIADYMADTAHLTTVEHGAYLLLIMTYWQRGEALPDDDKKLARICGLQGRNWKRVRAEIEPFFTFRDSKWVHQRIERQLEVMRSQRVANSLNGKKGALAKAKNSPSETQATAKRPLSHIEAEAETYITPKGVSADKPAPAFTFDDFIETWNEVAGECGLAVIKRKTEPRRRAFAARQKEYPEIDDWKAAFHCLQVNKWMHGDNKTGWRADPDFFLQAKSFTKLVEGQYGQAEK
jgi:uncharacterized protein YdaU (DUF1376 family)